MEEFIQMATKNLGIGDSSARSATGGLLQMIQNGVGGQDFSKLSEKIPGVDTLLKAAPTAEEGSAAGGSLLGGLMDKATAAVGGEAGSAMQLGGLLSKTGLDMGQGSKLVGMLVSFLKEKAGADFITKILTKVPELAKLGAS